MPVLFQNLGGYLQKPKTFPATYTGGINAVTQSTTLPTHPAADRARPPRIRRPRAPARLMSLHSQSVTQAHKPGRCAEAKRHRSRGGHPGARPGGGGPGQGQPACTATPRGLRHARRTRVFFPTGHLKPEHSGSGKPDQFHRKPVKSQCKFKSSGAFGNRPV